MFGLSQSNCDFSKWNSENVCIHVLLFTKQCTKMTCIHTQKCVIGRECKLSSENLFLFFAHGLLCFFKQWKMYFCWICLVKNKQEMHQSIPWHPKSPYWLENLKNFIFLKDSIINLEVYLRPSILMAVFDIFSFWTRCWLRQESFHIFFEVSALLNGYDAS